MLPGGCRLWNTIAECPCGRRRNIGDSNYNLNYFLKQNEADIAIRIQPYISKRCSKSSAYKILSFMELR